MKSFEQIIFEWLLAERGRIIVYHDEETTRKIAHELLEKIAYEILKVAI